MRGAVRNKERWSRLPCVIVNLCWWFNTQHVSFDSGRARERKHPKMLVLTRFSSAMPPALA